MGLERYLLHDFFTARELNDVDDRMKKLRRSNRQHAGATGRQMAELEADLAFLALMNRALFDILEERGLSTKAELLERMERFDTLDGDADGGLSPEALARDLGVTEPEPTTPKAPTPSRRRRR